MEGGRLPHVSVEGAVTNGPTEYPTKNTETISPVTSLLVSKLAEKTRAPPEGADEVMVALNIISAACIVISQRLYRRHSVSQYQNSGALALA